MERMCHLAWGTSDDERLRTERRNRDSKKRMLCWNIKTNATPQKHYLLYNAAAGSLSGLWAIRPFRKRVFCAFTLFVEEINTDRDKEQHFSLVPPGLETSVAWVFEVVVSLWSTHESGFLSANGELSQMGFMHGLDCLPVPGPSWEKLHFSLKGRRRRSPELLASPSVMQHCCPVTIPALPVIRLWLTGQCRVASTPPLRLLPTPLHLFPPLTALSLTISCSLSGPYIAYVTITKSTRIAAAIAWHGYI